MLVCWCMLYLLNLSIPCHPKANETFIKDRSLCAGHIQRLIFEQVVRHLGLDQWIKQWSFLASRKISFSKIYFHI